MKARKVYSLKINALLNGLRQVCAIVFSLVTFSYAARTLGKEAYGEYSFSLSIVNYCILIAGLGINTYSIREGTKYRDDNNRFNQFCSEIFSINIYSSLAALLALAAGILLSERFREAAGLLIIESISIVMILIGTDWINNILEDYLYLTIRYIVIQIITLTVTVIMIKSAEDIYLYAFISIIAMYGGNLINIGYIRKKVKIAFKLSINKQHIMPLFILFANSIAITIYVNSDITILGFFDSKEAVGEYSFSSKLYNSAKQVINAFIIVTLPRISSVLNDRIQYEYYMKKIIHGILLLLLPSVSLLYVLRKEVVVFLGGKGYADSSGVLAVLCIAIIFAILSSFMTNDILIVNRQDKKCLISTVISAGLNVVLNFILIPKFSIFAAAFTTVIAEGINLVIQFLYSRMYFNYKVFKLKKIVPCIVGNLISSAAAVRIYRHCRTAAFGNFSLILVTVTFAITIYCGTLIVCKDELAVDTFELVKNKLRQRYSER